MGMKTPKILLAVLTTAALGSAITAVSKAPCRENCQQTDCAAVVAPAVATTADPNVPQVNAKAGFLMEANSGKILMEHHADDRLPIASMTKVATLGVIYDALMNGELKMDEMVTVSDYAASMGGSQAFLDAGSQYSVRDLIQSIVVASANDSCVALAERIAGTVPNFVEKMNNFAKSVGCQNTNFVNCTGLPTPGAYSSARDMAKMYQRIMQSPHYGDFNHVWMYDLTHPSGRVTGLTNTNKLIRQYEGCLGGKTGFTNEAGHCLTVAAKRGALQPIAVVIGAPDSKTRFATARSMLDYAVNNFENRLLVDKTLPTKTITVKNAVEPTVDVYPARDCYQLTAKGQDPNITIATEIPDAVTAPLQPGVTCGKIFVMQDGKVLDEIDAVPNLPVPAATYWDNLQKLARQSRF